MREDGTMDVDRLRENLSEPMTSLPPTRRTPDHSPTRRLRRLAIALGSAVINRLQILLKMSRSIEYESVFAVIVARLLALGLTGGAVDAVDTSQQNGRRIVGIGEAVVGAR